MSSAMAKISKERVDVVIPAGRNHARRFGNGSVPITLSTMILTGTGVSRANGEATRLSIKIAMI